MNDPITISEAARECARQEFAFLLCSDNPDYSERGQFVQQLLNSTLAEREKALLEMVQKNHEAKLESDSLVASCDCLTKSPDIQHHKPGCRYRLISERDQLRAQLDAAREALKEVDALINESEGVAGLHMNGDVAPWSELLPGGRFEGWLLNLPRALQQLTKENK